MTEKDKGVCVYLPDPLLRTLDEAVYKRGTKRSSYVKELLLQHFSNGDEEIRTALLGRTIEENPHE